MSEQRAATCPLCGRFIPPMQKQCACGTVFQDQKPPGDSLSWAKNVDFGVLAPWVPAVGVLLLLVWLFAPPLALYYSLMPVIKVYLVVVILSSILALLAAEQLRKQGEPVVDTHITRLTTPALFGLLILGWPVTFPVFLRMHYEQSLPQRVKIGYLATALFILALLLVSFVVRRQQPAWNRDMRAAEVKPAAPTAASGNDVPVQSEDPAAPSPATPPVSQPAARPSTSVQPAVPAQQTPYIPQPGATAPPASGQPAQPVKPEPAADFGVNILAGKKRPK